jgi:hypothetical protein
MLIELTHHIEDAEKNRAKKEGKGVNNYIFLILFYYFLCVSASLRDAFFDFAELTT